MTNPMATITDTPRADSVRDELRDAVTDFNCADGDPEERARLIQRVRELRAMLAELNLERAED